MILYFDSYITDTPLVRAHRRELEEVRRKKSNYKHSQKIEIAKYSLMSYKMYPWSHELIRYELEDKKQIRRFDKFIRSIFPNATIIHERSDSQKDYKKSLELIEKWNDPWIFYAPNNDHPIISSDENIRNYIDNLLNLAQKHTKNYKFVSIMYSHLSEFLNIPEKGTPEHFLHGKGTKIIEENSLAKVYSMPGGDFSSLQITNINLLRKWFASEDLSKKRVIRSEDVKGYVKVKKQLIIVPKKEVCSHYDGYLHMIGLPNEIPTNKIPPLFIPPGFFENKVKIAYGYEKNRKGWVNINPYASKYSFEDNLSGTDLKLTLDQIPFFWRSHIEKIDVNSNLAGKNVEMIIRKREKILENPWNFTIQDFSISTVKYWTKFYIFRYYVIFRSFLGKVKKII